MNPHSRGEVTQLLIAWSNGDREAFAKLVPLVYDELRRIAASKLRRHGADAILQPTVLVHEAYLKLIDETAIEWQDRAHFYAIAANTIRRLIIDDYRKRLAEKRGGGKASFVSLQEGDAITTGQSVDLLAVHEALERLAALDPRQASIVEMRFFSDMTNEEIAAALGVSVKTVERDWRSAKAWLRLQLE